MDKVIVTGLLVVGSVTAAIVVIMTIGPQIGSSSQSVAESQKEAAGRIRTAIEIIAVSGNLTGDQVDAYVKNVGTVTIIAVDRSDVFLIKQGTRFSAPCYVSSSTCVGTVNSWNADIGGSSVGSSGFSWDRGDTLHLRILLTGDTADGKMTAGDHKFRFSTPNAILAEKTFEKPS